MNTSDRVAATVSRRSAVPRTRCKNAKRRRRLESDPPGWLKWYLAEAYTRPFERPHTEIIEGVMTAHRDGGRFVVAGERGIGKSALLWGLVLYLRLSGQQVYPVCIPWAAPAMKRAFRFWKNALCFNDRLAADYPEYCAPFRHAKGVSQRVMVTTWADTGELTGAQLTVGEGMIVLPDGLGCIGGSTINGNVRGLNHPQEDGSVLRPTIAMLDDVQDRKTASSPMGVRKTVEIIDGDVAGIGEAGCDLPVLMACNCICRGDVPEHYIEDDDWHSLRVPCVEQWPDGWEDKAGPCRKLWQEWHELQKTGGDELAFYLEHKDEMTAGMRLSAPAAFQKSAKIADPLYGAMRLYFRMGHAAFWAEQQQEPVEVDTRLYALTPSVVCAHAVDTMPRLHVPETTTIITAFVDINRGGLHWCVGAFGQDMTCHVPAYGRFPGRGDLYDENATSSVWSRAVFGGLHQVAQGLAGMTFTRGDQSVRIGTLFVDRGGQYAEIAHRFASAASFPFRVLPAWGYAANKYMIHRSTLIGAPMEQCHIVKSQYGAFVAYSACYWREVAQRAFLGLPAEPGGCTLYGGQGKRHHVPFAEQVCADRLHNKYDTDAGPRWDWHRRPGAAEHWGDALKGCYVAAALAGLSASGMQLEPVVAKRTKRRVRHVPFNL